MSTYTIPVTEVKNKLTSLLKNIRDMWDRIIITRNGRNEAVILSYEEYESWIETLSLSEEEKEAILEGRKAIAKSDVLALSDLL
ncbi:MAG: type II toxin-antitoxin system Phd/YefM family antitoxin [Candidatus Marinimicrobia bacterium]|nr:type II toxin-antitoxin system Phd/YefM family antitoxin [Candidatus Neomarinimicrobiota bacterium]